MPAYRLLAACKDYLWGGHRALREEFGIESTLDPLAEAWVLSCHPDGPSTIASGPWAGRTLPEYLAEAGPAALGSNCAGFDRFPLLVKLIDTEKDLSVQVHPSDEYALAHEGQYGKSELWVVLRAKPGAFLYYGFERESTREAFARAIEEGTLLEQLHRAPVKTGDVFFIPAGTLHAIGAGMVIAEIQQNSNVTYRVYDYGRIGADGRPRPLHIEQALAVTRCAPAPAFDFGPHLGSCRYFTVDAHDGPFAANCGSESFHALLAVSGTGSLHCGGEAQPLQAGSCYFIPANSGRYFVEGDCKTLSILVVPPMETA